MNWKESIWSIWQSNKSRNQNDVLYMKNFQVICSFQNSMTFWVIWRQNFPSLKSLFETHIQHDRRKSFVYIVMRASTSLIESEYHVVPSFSESVLFLISLKSLTYLNIHEIVWLYHFIPKHKDFLLDTTLRRWIYIEF